MERGMMLGCIRWGALEGMVTCSQILQLNTQCTHMNNVPTCTTYPHAQRTHMHNVPTCTMYRHPNSTSPLYTPTGYSEVVSAKEEWLASVPDALPLQEAGGVPLVALTAVQVGYLMYTMVGFVCDVYRVCCIPCVMYTSR